MCVEKKTKNTVRTLDINMVRPYHINTIYSVFCIAGNIFDILSYPQQSLVSRKSSPFGLFYHLVKVYY